DSAGHAVHCNRLVLCPYTGMPVQNSEHLFKTKNGPEKLSGPGLAFFEPYDSSASSSGGLTSIEPVHSSPTRINVTLRGLKSQGSDALKTEIRNISFCNLSSVPGMKI